LGLIDVYDALIVEQIKLGNRSISLFDFAYFLHVAFRYIEHTVFQIQIHFVAVLQRADIVTALAFFCNDLFIVSSEIFRFITICFQLADPRVHVFPVERDVLVDIFSKNIYYHLNEFRRRCLFGSAELSTADRACRLRISSHIGIVSYISYTIVI